MSYDDNSFKWAIDESLWDDKGFLLDKLSNLKSGMYKGNANSNLCEKIKLIDTNIWKDKKFVNQVIKANGEVLFSLFVLSPIFENIDEQIELEKTLLENINESTIKDFSYMWNSYLKYNYLYYHRNNEFMQYIGENEYQFSSDNKDKGFFSMFYNHEKGILEENKNKYKVIIDILEQEIFSPKIINTINSSNFKEEEYNKIIIQNLHQGTSKIDGEIYNYLPVELKNNKYLTENYIEWAEDNLNELGVHNIHNRPRNMELLGKIKKYQSNISVDYNAVPLEYFNEDLELKKMKAYLKSFVLNPMSKKANHKLSLGKKSLIIKQWMSDEDSALNVLKCVIAIRYDQIVPFWDKYLAKTMKENKNFVLNFLNVPEEKTLILSASAKNDIFKILPDKLKNDKDIQLAYLNHSGSLNNLNKFALYELDDIKDYELIKTIIANNSNIFMSLYYLKNEEDLEYKNKMLNKIASWRVNVDFLCAYTQNISYIHLTKNEWEILLGQENAIDRISEVNNFKTFISYLPKELHTEEIILKSLKAYKNIGLSLEIEDKFFQNPEFCHELLKSGSHYINKIPDEFWDNKQFFMKVFESVDNKEIGLEIIKDLPIRVKQFLEMYDINDNYTKALTSALLRDKLSNKLEAKLETQKKRKL